MALMLEASGGALDDWRGKFPMSLIYRRSALASIAGGVLAAGGATALLVRDVTTTGLTVDIALMPVLVGTTILAGHLFSGALRSFRLVSAVGLALLACMGSVLTVYETVGRRAELRDTKVASAALSESNRAHLTQMLREAEEALKVHRQNLSVSCPTGVGPKCKGLEYTVSTWEHAVTGYEAKLAKLGDPRPVDARADRVVALAGLVTSVPADKVRSFVATVEPLTMPLFLELGSIILFGFGLKAWSRSAPEVKEAVTERDLAQEPLTPSEIDELLRILRRARRPLSNGELANALAISAGEASKRVKDAVAAGLVSKEKVGRHVAIATLH